MNEKINIAELLKKYAKEGEVFWSKMFGRVRYNWVSDWSGAIYVEQNGKEYTYTSFGEWEVAGECLLLPSKDQRDWLKWAEEREAELKAEQKPKFEFRELVLCKGDLSVQKWFLGEYTHTSKDGYHYLVGGFAVTNCIPYEGNEHLLGTNIVPGEGGNNE